MRSPDAMRTAISQSINASGCNGMHGDSGTEKADSDARDLHGMCKEALIATMQRSCRVQEKGEWSLLCPGASRTCPGLNFLDFVVCCRMMYCIYTVYTMFMDVQSHCLIVLILCGVVAWCLMVYDVILIAVRFGFLVEITLQFATLLYFKLTDNFHRKYSRKLTTLTSRNETDKGE